MTIPQAFKMVKKEIIAKYTRHHLHQEVQEGAILYIYVCVCACQTGYSGVKEVNRAILLPQAV